MIPLRQHLSVLVAEDDFLVSTEIVNLLTELGYSPVWTASTGAQAIQEVRRRRPDAVLMDLNMPGIGGIEATRAIQDGYPTPVIILTAYDSLSVVDQAIEAGASAYLSKPPSARELDRAIIAAVARHEELLRSRLLADQLTLKNRRLQKALAEIHELQGIIPMCMHCKKIRTDDGYWQRVDTYISQRTGAMISHGICDDCARELYPGLNEE